MCNARRRLFRLGFSFLLVLAFWPRGAEAQVGPTVVYLDGKLSVAMLPEPTSDGRGTWHGYQVPRFRISNRDTTSHRVELTASRDGYGFHLQRLHRAVEVGPESSVLVSIPVPATEGGPASHFVVTIDGAAQRQAVPTRDGNHRAMDRWSRAPASYSVLTSRGIPAGVREAIVEAAPSGSPAVGVSVSPFGGRFYGGGGVGERSVFKSEQPLTGWSDHWLGYSRFDGVVVTATELKEAPQTVMDALIRYVACGGILVVRGSGWKPPSPWDERLDPMPDLEASYVIGAGRICVVAETVALPGPLESLWVSAADDALSPDSESVNRELPVVEHVTIPVRGMLVLIIAFAVVIGPVNIIVLRQIKRRIWLLWTVPSVSLATSALVFAFALVMEGYAPTRRAATFTLLDQRTHHATTLGWVAFYAPLTPRDGLRFGYDTELSVALHSYQQTDRAVALDWTHDQHLARGWVRARVPIHFRVRKSETRRERVTVDFSGEAPTAVNGLGAPIALLYATDSEGRIYSTSQVAAGQQVTLSPTGRRSPPNSRSDVGDWLRHSGGDLAGRARRDYSTLLGSNAYLAILETTSPFIEPGIERAKERECVGVVLGILGDSS